LTTPTGSVLGRLDDLHLENGLTLMLSDGRRRQVPLADVLAISAGDGDDDVERREDSRGTGG
jgi:hypothetical protein